MSNDENKKILRLTNGARVSDYKNSLQAGENGPLLISDTPLIETLAHFDRERIPERVVHAKGAGAFGFFELSHDLSAITKADVFQGVGKRTPVLTRFSTVGGEKGSADAERDPRGFAVKHYTSDGVFDMVGNNTPIFFIRDPLLFPRFIHTQKRNPQTNLKDANAFWDFAGNVPESTHQFLFLFSDRGTPRTYRHMNGYSSHALKFVNAAGDVNFVKFHYKPTVGVHNLTASEAAAVAARDADHATRDLHEHIAKGGEAEWRVHIQLMPAADVATYRFDPFDLTKVWPHGDYPLQEIGRLVLNRHPSNYFADIEQAAFSPSNLVTGIEPSPDRMLQARLFSYPDTQRHRLGVNYQQLPVNCPFATRGGVHNYHRDGAASFDNGGGEVNYHPNSHAAAPAASGAAAAEHAYAVRGTVARRAHTHVNDDFAQPGDFYRRVLNADERTRLVDNIAAHMRQVSEPRIVARAVANFYRADCGLGERLAAALRVPMQIIIDEAHSNSARL